MALAAPEFLIFSISHFLNFSFSQFQGDYHNFAWRTKTEGNDASQALGHVQGPLATTVEAAELTKAPGCRRPAEDLELPAVGVPAESELGMRMGYDLAMP